MNPIESSYQRLIVAAGWALLRGEADPSTWDYLITAINETETSLYTNDATREEWGFVFEAIAAADIFLAKNYERRRNNDPD